MKPWSSRIFWPAAGAIIFAAALFFTACMLRSQFKPGDEFRLEMAKLFYQFLLVTAAGGILLAYLKHRRDREQAAACRVKALQDLAMELSGVHRRLKLIKRRTRSKLERCDPPPGEEGRWYQIDRRTFEQALDSLLRAQIAGEEVRARITLRTDLLKPRQIEDIRAALRYATRYFHDVYEDHERAYEGAGRTKARRVEDRYLLTEEDSNIADFLLSRWPPPEAPEDEAGGLESLLKQMRHGHSAKERFGALRKIEGMRQAQEQEQAQAQEQEQGQAALEKPGQQQPAPSQRRGGRYRRVATAAFGLAVQEVRRAIPDA